MKIGSREVVQLGNTSDSSGALCSQGIVVAAMKLFGSVNYYVLLKDDEGVLVIAAYASDYIPQGLLQGISLYSTNAFGPSSGTTSKYYPLPEELGCLDRYFTDDNEMIESLTNGTRYTK